MLGKKKEIEAGVRKTKEVMAKFGEGNNDGKEEELNFGMEKSGKIRMLGSWMGWKVDIEVRPN